MDLSNSDEIVLGADPEIFVESGGGANIPAFEFLPSKYEPAKTLEEGMNYYWDGFQTEFNITPSANLQTCLASIKYGLKAILEAAHKKDASARLSSKTVIEVPLDTLTALPVEFTEFGCMPSYNIYGISGLGGEGCTVPFRFAGGHIHFGIGEHGPETIRPLMHALDSILGVACVSLFENLDNPVRRAYYGLAGEFRLPPHGLEYRVLSDAWLFDPTIAACILELSRKIVASVFANTNNWQAEPGEVVKTILTNNADAARDMLDRNRAMLQALGCSIDLTKPVEHSIPNITNITKNWNI